MSTLKDEYKLGFLEANFSTMTSGNFGFRKSLTVTASVSGASLYTCKEINLGTACNLSLLVTSVFLPTIIGRLPLCLLRTTSVHDSLVVVVKLDEFP